jgi:3-oxoacyl-[acyl-carrier protein] reductase
MSALEGRVALVTGGAQGIGEAIGRALAARGASVVLGDLAAEAAAGAARALDPSETRVSAVALDVRSSASFRAALDATLVRHGRLDVLVNNAAITLRRAFFEIDEAEWDEVLAVNLRGVFLGCRLAGELMRERGAGRIVNVSSLAGQVGGLVSGAHYAASKAGILVLTKVVARELAAYGVTVNTVAPAAIDGPVMAALPAAQVEALRGSIPVGRLGSADEVAAVVAFLASDEAAFVTGATFDVNGGLLMR